MTNRLFRYIYLALGFRPNRWHPDLKYGIRARWWLRMEEVNRTEVMGPLSVSPFRIVR